MSDIEGFQPTNNFERASKALTAEADFVAEAHVEMKLEEGSEKLNKATAEYEAAQAKLDELQKHFEKCNADAATIRETDPARYGLLTVIGKTIHAEIVEWEKKRDDAQKALMAATPAKHATH